MGSPIELPVIEERKDSKKMCYLLIFRQRRAFEPHNEDKVSSEEGEGQMFTVLALGQGVILLVILVILLGLRN